MSVQEQYWRYALITIILGLGVTIFIKALPYVGGLLGAFTLYILLRNQMFILTERHRFRKGWAAALILIEAIACFLIPISAIVWMIVNKLQGVNLDPNSIIEPAKQFARLIEARTGYNLLVTDNLVKLASWLPKVGQVFMEWIGSFTVNIFVLIIVLYFMLTGGRKMEHYLYGLLPFNQQDGGEILHKIKLIVQSNAIGIPLLALIQGGIATIGYWIFGVPNLLLFGLLTSFATIIPIVGTMIVWVPLTVLQYFDGSLLQAGGLLVYGVAVISQCDNVLRMFLQKKMADTHPLITIFGVIAGLPLFGFMGVIFGPLIVAMFLLFLDMFAKQYVLGGAAKAEEQAKKPDAP